MPRNSASISRVTPLRHAVLSSRDGRTLIVDSSAMPYILALDQGTTSSRAIVFDHDGAIPPWRRRSSRRSFRSPAGSSTTRSEIWASQIGVAVEALGRAAAERRATSPPSASPTSARRRSCGIATTGEPVHNAIVWQDRRTADFCDRLKADGARADGAAKTGLVIDAYFSASKIRWILDNVAGRARDAPTPASSRSARSTRGWSGS